jgi:hypothetical protein
MGRLGVWVSYRFIRSEFGRVDVNCDGRQRHGSLASGLQAPELVERPVHLPLLRRLVPLNNLQAGVRYHLDRGMVHPLIEHPLPAVLIERWFPTHCQTMFPFRERRFGLQGSPLQPHAHDNSFDQDFLECTHRVQICVDAISESL